jgi:spore germination cell wall hydrolase CwlJ-like protein
MSQKFRIASTISLLATILTTLLSSGGSGAQAQELQIVVPEAPSASGVPEQKARNGDLPAEAPLPQDNIGQLDKPTIPRTASTLAAMAETIEAPAKLPREIECMASAIYFEAKSETLAGQLAVGRVIAARANSGRFPGSYCGVVLQKSQFSFIRGGVLPTINRTSATWQRAVKIALIADRGVWRSPVEGALFFHAARVSPAWGKARMAQIDNHIFYR